MNPLDPRFWRRRPPLLTEQQFREAEAAWLGRRLREAREQIMDVRERFGVPFFPTVEQALEAEWQRVRMIDHTPGAYEEPE